MAPPTGSPAGIALATLLVGGLTVSACAPTSPDSGSPASDESGELRDVQVRVTLPPDLVDTPLDGRLVVVFSNRDEGEPRFHATEGPAAVPLYGIDVEEWVPGTEAVLTDTVFGFPVGRLGALPPGTYRVQAIFNRYQTFTRSDGHTVKLPPDRGEGQQWNRKPGNLLSAPSEVTVGPGAASVSLELSEEIPPVADFAEQETDWVKYVRIRSERLSEFWGTDVHLAAWVLLPAGWAEHPDARYPLAVFHGHFPSSFSHIRTQPPDTTEPCVYSARFDLDCYNRVQEEERYRLFQQWSGPGFPRMLVAEIQHPTPYYDDSYAVNSENNGPYGDAIQYELIPAIEERFRGIGEGWARFTYGGSTGGWEAMAVQVFYPDEYNGAFIACPDPIDFRAYTVVDLYEDENAYWIDAPFKRTPRPGRRDYLGHISSTLWEMNHYELVLGTRSRSGQQWDIWEAVYSPVGDDGYPRRIWDKVTGDIDPEVAAHWRENYDLMHIVRRDWPTLGPRLRGKLHIYVGEMDNYYLNNAVYLAEDFLAATTDPPFDGEIAYGARDEHCWNGDPDQPNAVSRLRYISMYVDRIVERATEAAPPGADLTSWRY